MSTSIVSGLKLRFLGKLKMFCSYNSVATKLVEIISKEI